MQNKDFRVEIGVVCFVLFIIIVLQYRTIKKNSEVVAQSFGNEQLKGTLIQEKEKYDRMAEENEKISKKLEEVRTNAEKTTTSSNDISEKLKKNDMLLGLTNVKGSGIIIVAKDAKAALATDDINKFLVHDVDLREISKCRSTSNRSKWTKNSKFKLCNMCRKCYFNKRRESIITIHNKGYRKCRLTIWSINKTRWIYSNNARAIINIRS